jgi:Helicase associated domain
MQAAAAATNDHHDDDYALLLQVLQTPLPPLPHIQNARKSFAHLTQEEFEAEVQLERTRRRNGGSSCASEKQQQQQHASGSSLPSLQEEANNHQNDSKKQAAAAPTSIDPLTTATAAGAADDGSKKRAPPPAPAVLAHTDVKNHGTSTTTTAGRYHNSKRQRACHSLPLPLCPPPIFPIAPHAFAFAFPSLPSSFPTSYQHQNHHPLPAVATAASMMQQQQPVWYPQYPPRPPQPIVAAVPPAASGVRRPPATAAAVPRKMTAPATTTKVTKQPLVGVGVPPAQRTPVGGGTAATTTTTAVTATTSTRNQNTTTVALLPPAEAQQQQRLERFQAQWDKMYKELEKFRAEFGHACVPKPKRDPRYKSLRSWTNRQKKHWKLFLNGEKSALNQADIDKLIVVGLGTRRGPNDWNASRMESSWKSSYDELVAFRNVHGHCNVSRHHHRATHRSLGIWVSTQRKCFQNRQLKATTGEKRFQHYGIMSDLQFERLKALSFSFILENTNKKNDHENNDNSNGRDGDDDESDDAEEEENEQEYYG